MEWGGPSLPWRRDGGVVGGSWWVGGGMFQLFYLDFVFNVNDKFVA